MMFGVVIWSDHKDRKAVIWCEDHGDLAFCQESVDDQGCVLDTGDLIQFDVTLQHDMRLVHHPRKVSEGAYQGLADTLRMLPIEGPVAVPVTFGARATDAAVPDSAPTDAAPTDAGLSDVGLADSGIAEIIPFEQKRSSVRFSPFRVAERAAR
ncbi:hypothetical protein LA6_001588 [Marinibacterium anthonyi]|nr:hypothetical protein LA6_001588 [Marinibacterium anthonyi]